MSRRSDALDVRTHTGAHVKQQQDVDGHVLSRKIAGLLLVILFFVLNWFGDSLDGTLARVRNRQRPRYGFYLDHVLDACGSVFVFAGLALSGYMSERIAVGLLVAYFLLSIEVYLATY